MEMPAWLRDAVAGLPCTRLEDRTAWDAWVLWLSPRPDPRPRDRWFGLLMHHPDGRVLLTLKGDPDVNALRCAQSPWMSPGHHMNHRHWVSLDLSHNGFDVDEACAAVEDAWDVTVDALPRRLRDPLLAMR